MHERKNFLFLSGILYVTAAVIGLAPIFRVSSARTNVRIPFESHRHEPRPALDFEAYIRKPLRVEQKHFTGQCPMSIRFQAIIISNGPGTAHYRWVWSDGGTSRDESVTFRRAGSKVVSATWSIGAAGASLSGWGAIKLLSPTESEPVRIMEFNLTCR